MAAERRRVHDDESESQQARDRLRRRCLRSRQFRIVSLKFLSLKFQGSLKAIGTAMMLKEVCRVGVIGVGLLLASFAVTFADDEPAWDESAIADAIRREDTSAMQTLLLPLITTTFGSRIQTRNLNLWLMRSYPSDAWSVVHACLEVRIEDSGTWTEWLPASVWAAAPSGDQHPQPNGLIAGWDPNTGTRRFASLKGYESAAIENAVETMRTECYHLNDDSKAAERKGLLKRLSP